MQIFVKAIVVIGLCIFMKKCLVLSHIYLCSPIRIFSKTGYITGYILIPQLVMDVVIHQVGLKSEKQPCPSYIDCWQLSFPPLNQTCICLSNQERTVRLMTLEAGERSN